MDDSGRGEFLRFLRKPVNFRPILFCALSFGVGIFFFGRFAAKGALAAVFAFVAVLAAICVALPFCIGRRRKVYLITSAFCLAFVALGLLAADIAFKSISAEDSKRTVISFRAKSNPFTKTTESISQRSKIVSITARAAANFISDTLRRNLKSTI